MLAIKQRAQRSNGLRDNGDWADCLEAYPAQKILSARRDAQAHAAAAQLVERGGGHGHLGWVEGVRIDNAGADLDAPRSVRDGTQQHPHAAQEKIIADPELVETGGFRGCRQARILRDGQVVVETDAKAHRRAR